MKIEVEAVSSVKKSIRIEVPQETVSHEFNHQLGHLQKEAYLPGFRPGKAPIALLLKKYQKNIEEEVLRKLIPEYCQKAIEQSGIVPVVLPSIEKIDFNKDAPLFFTALVDTFPEINLASYTGLILPKKEIPVTDADIEKGLAILVDQNGYLEALPDDHLIADSNYVIIDFIGESDGKILSGGKQKDYPVQMGSNKTRPEIDAALLGKKKGERVVVESVIPADDPEKEIAGKIAHFTIDIKDIKAKRLPVLDDEFAKDLGLANLTELRERVRESIAIERSKIQEQSQKNHLMDQLIVLHPIEAPQPMVAHEFQGLLRQNKMTVDSDPARVKEVVVAAENRVKGTLILTAIAEKEKIEALDSEIEEVIKQMAARSAVPFEKAKADVYKDPHVLENLKDSVRGEKTLNWLYSQSQFEEMKEG